MKRLLNVLVAGLLSLPLLAQAQSPTETQAPADTDAQPGLAKVARVRVTAPYLELHTGPGRGYPVFFVAERDAWVSIELRHTDWYKVRAATGQLGWVHREQLSTTLAEAGAARPFRDVVIDDYLRRRVEMGAAYGRFKSEPVIRLWAGYRMSDTLSLEASASQVQGVFSGSSLWQVNLLSEPWFNQRLSPFFGIGVGRFLNVPNKSLVDNSVTNANMAQVMLGARYHLSDRFVLRADWTLHSVFLSDERSAEYRAFAAGVSFFF